MAASSEQDDCAVQRWRDEIGLDEEADFRQWLSAHRMAHDTFRSALSAADASMFAEKPRWAAALERAFSFSPSMADADSVFASLPELAPHERAFLLLTEPLVRGALHSLRNGIHVLQWSVEDLPFEPGTVDRILLGTLVPQLLQRVTRTLTLELNVARLREQLAGETPEERFDSFGRRLADPESAAAILNEYPVLARGLVECLENWTRFSLEFLRHLIEDRAELQETFGRGVPLGRLQHLEGGVGDTHRGGRSVQIVTFDSGIRVVYKPRSLEVDARFHELLGWVNQHDRCPPLLVPRLLAREGYGWYEFIEAAECHSAAEIERFYHRQGAYLALLYALEATDVHLENLIAAGEHPVLVDLEALFHPRLPSKNERSPGSAMRETVLRIGMLPAAGSRDAHESSALGGAAGQMTPLPVLTLEGKGTDTMRLVRKRLRTPGSHNRPRLSGEFVDPGRYSECVVDGFTAVYQLLLDRRSQLLAPGGLIERFRGAEIRVVLRPTLGYARFLIEAAHPNLLRDALDQDRFLNRLWYGVEQNPYLTRVIRAELADLAAGDVPIFTTRPQSRDLWTSTGERVPEFLERASLEAVRDRLHALSPADLQRQVWFIRASLATLVVTGHRLRNRTQRTPDPARRASRAELVAAAGRLGDRLQTMALRDEGHISWIGITLSDSGRWSLQPVAHDLFAGAAGIALFLAYLGRATGHSPHSALARRLALDARSERARLVEEGADQRTVGVFTGWAGWMYTCTHLGRLWDCRGCFEEAAEIAAWLSESIDCDEELDVIGGAAGFIGALLSLHHQRPSSTLRDMIRRCADRLTTTALPMDAGVAWRTTPSSDRPLTGFAHGAAGISWSLIKAAALTRDPNHLATALRGIDYERSVFVPEIGNWPDFRRIEGQPEPQHLQAMIAWCHGAAGIGIARLEAADRTAEPRLAEDLRMALHTTLRDGFGPNHSLCHGDLGNAEFLLQAARRFGDPRLYDATYRHLGRIVAEVESEAWICGTPEGIETPGLMTGLAGIGYGLLRFASPARVPSVLSLETPPRRWASRRTRPVVTRGSRPSRVLLSRSLRDRSSAVRRSNSRQPPFLPSAAPDPNHRLNPRREAPPPPGESTDVQR